MDVIYKYYKTARKNEIICQKLYIEKNIRYCYLFGNCNKNVIDFRYFAVLSPQDNTVAGSIVNDACHKRFEDGLPALALHYNMEQV